MTGWSKFWRGQNTQGRVGTAEPAPQACPNSDDKHDDEKNRERVPSETFHVLPIAWDITGLVMLQQYTNSGTVQAYVL